MNQVESRHLTAVDTSFRYWREAKFVMPIACRQLAHTVKGNRLMVAYADSSGSDCLYLAVMDLEEQTSWLNVVSSPVPRIRWAAFTPQGLLCVGEESNQLAIWQVDPNQGTHLVRKIYTGPESRWMDAALDPDTGELWLLWFESGQRLYLQRFGADGEPLERKESFHSQDQYCFKASLHISGGDYFIVGTYGENRRSAVEGLFCFTATAGGDRFRPLPFSQLKALVEVMVAENNKDSRKIARLLDKDKPLDLDHDLLISGVRKLDQGDLVWTVELAHPVYRTETYREPGPDDREETRTVRIFMGWENQFALVLGTDRDGNHQWDRAIPLQPELQPYLYSQVQQNWKGQQGQFLYLYDEKPRMANLLLQGNAPGWQTTTLPKPTEDRYYDPLWGLPWYGDRLLLLQSYSIGNASGTASHATTYFWPVRPE